MASGGAVKESIGTRLTLELREFAVIAAYLYVCFTALLHMKAAILRSEGVAFAPFALAVVKALICAKFVLVGRALHLGERYKSKPLIWPTLHRSFAFLMLLWALNVLEEIVVGYFHRRSIVDSIAAVGGGTLDQVIATSVLVMLIFIPFFAFRSLGEVLGERNLVRVFFLPRHQTEGL